MDAEIAGFVDANQMLLITKDGDFRDDHLPTGKPARVLRLTLGMSPMGHPSTSGLALNRVDIQAATGWARPS